MTSPQAVTTDVAAAMAAAQVKDDAPPTDQTATTAVNAEHDYAGPEPEADHGTDVIIDGGATGDEDVMNALDGMMGIQGQHYLEQPPPAPPEASIPEGAELSQDTQSGLGPQTQADMDHLMALGALLNMQPMDGQGLYFNNHIAPGPDPMDMTLGAAPGNTNAFLDPSPDIQPDIQPSVETRIAAYAKLQFEDTEFYMNTYSIILGRDILAAKAAARRDSHEARKALEQQMLASEDPKTPTRPRTQGSQFSRSAVSESGGILRDGDDSDSDSRARRRERKLHKASKKTKSTGSSVRHQSRRNSLVMPNGRIQPQPQAQTRRTVPETAGAVPVDPASLRPSPNDCPVVGIHPPGNVGASGYKAISREHVKIAFNPSRSLFEAIIIGRNGAFIDEVFCHHKEVIELKSGSKLQIGSVVMKFILPDVAEGETGAENRLEYDEGDDVVADRYSEGGKEMSFDFEETARVGALNADTSEEASDEEERGRKRHRTALESFETMDASDDEDEADEYPNGEDYGEDDAEGEEDFDANGYGLANSVEDQDSQDEAESGSKPHLQPNDENKPQKKRGPGRPPKNGIMSKREQQLAKKEALAQEKAKKTVPQQSETGKESLEGKEPKEGKDGKVKNKVGRPRKHPRPDTPPIKTEKRKYTKRKPKDPNDPNAKQDGSGDEKKPKKEKAPKPPRSPSPTFNEADLTPEQLAKPQANYVTLIYDALAASPAGQMSLPQIYRAIMRKYPFFVLKCSTNGWQSSVRHNLSQHHAFKKVERDGKGWMWAIVDGVSIEKEKKRRSPPPPAAHHYPQQIYAGPPPPGYMPYGPGMMHQPGYPMPPMPQYQSGQPPQHYMQGPPQMNGYPQPPPGHMHAQPPQAFAPPIPAQMAPAVAGGGTYSSPYAPKPTTTASSPQSTDNQAQTSQPPQTYSQQMHPVQPQPQTQGQQQPNGAPPAQMQPHGQQQQQQQQTQQPATSQAPVTATTSTASTAHQGATYPISAAPQAHPPAQNTVAVPGRPQDQIMNQSQAANHIQSGTQNRSTMQAPSPVQTHVSSQQPPQQTGPPQKVQQGLLPAPNGTNTSLSTSINAILNSNNTLKLVINNFKANLLKSINTANAESVIESAIAGVLGISTKREEPGDEQYEAIVSALNMILPKIPNLGFKPQQPSNLSMTGSQQSPSPQPASLTPSVQERTGPAIARPSFASQGQGRSFPKPPMTTSIKRTESASPAPPRPGTASSVSPAPTASSAATVANTPAAAPSVEAGQIAGQKRPLEDAEDLQDYKRLSTSGPPQLKA